MRAPRVRAAVFVWTHIAVALGRGSAQSLLTLLAWWLMLMVNVVLAVLFDLWVNGVVAALLGTLWLHGSLLHRRELRDQ